MYAPIPSQLGKKPRVADVIVFAFVAFLFYGIIATASRWSGTFSAESTISLDYSELPVYAVYSLFRGLVAYLLSLVFTLCVGYLAAKNRTAERIILPLLDIGQSIPVLGFLPGLVLGLISIFPNSNLGLELACILMIFTSQVWNMAFSFYASVKSVPAHISEVVSVIGLSRAQRLFKVEFPYSATGLAWNSLMSMAGGWFFLSVCESFQLGHSDFRLPGVGSYMSVAIEQGNTPAMFAGLGTMLIIVLFMDFFFWRPIIAWTGKFRGEEKSNTTVDIPFMNLLLKDSRVVQALVDVFGSIWESLVRVATHSTGGVIRERPKRRQKRNSFWKSRRTQELIAKTGLFLLYFSLFLMGFWVIGKLYVLIEPLMWRDWVRVFQATLLTSARVTVAIVLAASWTIPAGILIGLSPRLAGIFQPIVQILASFPTPMLYPLVILALSRMGIGLGVGATFLMCLGIQWYILFNVLDGAMGISAQHRDTFRVIGLNRTKLWIKLYLPSVFPSLATGLITAAGAAWNATIVTEYVQVQGEPTATLGLGSMISQATAGANYPLLAASLLVMVTVVVTLNQTLWRFVYNVAETRYRSDA